MKIMTGNELKIVAGGKKEEDKQPAPEPTNIPGAGAKAIGGPVIDVGRGVTVQPQIYIERGTNKPVGGGVGFQWQ